MNEKYGSDEENYSILYPSAIKPIRIDDDTNLSNSN